MASKNWLKERFDEDVYWVKQTKSVKDVISVSENVYLWKRIINFAATIHSVIWKNWF